MAIEENVGEVVVLDAVIAEDQRTYIEGVRIWLEDSYERRNEIFEGIY